MDDESFDVPGLPRRRRAAGPGLGAVVLVSLLTSVAASVATVVALARLGSPLVAPAAPPAPAVAAGAPPGDGAAARDGVSVPDLVRVPIENARSVAEALGLELVVREQRADPTAAAGVVVSQAPARGARLPRGARLEVVVAAGVAAAGADAASADAAVTAGAVAGDAATADAPSGDRVAVPRVVGQRVQRARAMLERAGLRVGAQRGGYDEDVSPDVVLRQSPAAATEVPRGSAVDLVVNRE